MNRVHVVFVTGMSGAGRSTALHVLEDLGFFCVDNLPPRLAPELVALLDDGEEIRRVGLGVDVRTGAFLERAEQALEQLREAGHEVEVLFVDASDETLVHRFSETRRPHPLAPGGDLPRAIERERDRLSTLRSQAARIFDTTDLSVHELRRDLVDHVARGSTRRRMVTRVVSFGFKYGLPVDADLVFDLRYLPNPHFVPELRPKTGLDPEVSGFVFESGDAVELVDDVSAMLSKLMPKYEVEGKAYLTVAVGCTGGRHRSVAVAEELKQRLGASGDVVVSHRDVGREHL